MSDSEERPKGQNGYHLYISHSAVAFFVAAVFF